ncbi:MAG: threonine--tRNA ligase [Nitrosopumilales archaeon]|jgi:threonyl-tRNA synthetase|nr:MAG: threonine--tRNA ligase [Nitrosopumilales archaeon]
MRILLLHADFIEYQPISKEIQAAEDIPSKSSNKIYEVIVALIAVEKDDDESIIDEVGNELKTYGEMIKCDSLLIYPYAHLSSDLATHTAAQSILNSIEIKTRDLFKIVNRAPFGWTKSFNLKIKGHPLAEHAKTIQKKTVGKTNTESTAESIALKSEEVLKSSWYVLVPEGNLVPMNEYTFEKDSALRKLADYELSKKRTVVEVPPHVKLMKRLAIADYEPSSDGGNMRYYPKGRLMKSLIETYVTKMIHEYGGIEVETPVMYDSNHPSIHSYFNRFPARQYNIQSDNKQLFLRFAACFGQFLMAKDFQISYKQLPLKLYELTRYSFRREKSGELVGLRRLRAFSMPDCHAFCRDMDQAKEEFVKRFELSIRVIEGLGLSSNDDVDMVIRFTSDFYEQNKEFIKTFAARLEKPILVEMWKERFFYFIVKWEFNFIDSLGKAAALSTDQIDVENGERYKIEFVDSDGQKKYPIILHNSPSGAIERVMFALLEKTDKDTNTGKVPALPLWLSHTQVRVIPVASKHLEFSEKILDELGRNNIRADIDDRELSVAKKIREAESEWIHFILVIGDKEVGGNELVVRERVAKSQYGIALDNLIKKIKLETSDKPYLPLNLPAYLSKRPLIMV